jgi:MFS family permease
LIIIASSLGAVFEWYDFYLYGLLATIITAQFFSGVNETTGFIFALAAFAAGFAVRPFGALVFGRIGDVVGRKNTFLVTMAIMGLSTFLVGLLPSYASVGVAAPIALVMLRLLQGLALGGEYGGAATYVAEHAPDNKRGLFTSFIQTTASLGLFAALLIVIGVRTLVGEEAFAAWGWRIPFIVSIALLAVSLWIRMQLEESPVFQKMKDEGKTSKAPLTEAFGQWSNLKVVLIALFGAVVGQGVVFYTSQFYALFFLEKNLRVDGPTTNILIAIALLIATPAFILFGWLSDRIGRKYIILTGCALAALTYMPLFHALSKAANPALYAAQANSPVAVVANPDECSVQFDPVGKNKFDRSSCDIAKAYLAKAGISYANVVAPAGTVAQIHIGGATIPVVDPAIVSGPEKAAAIKAFGRDPRHPRALRDDGLRSDRGAAGRAVPDADPLHVDVAALSYRQWLVRRLPADRGVRDGRGHRGYLLRALVPDRRLRGDGAGRAGVPAGDVPPVAAQLDRCRSRLSECWGGRILGPVRPKYVSVQPIRAGEGPPPSPAS